YDAAPGRCPPRLGTGLAPLHALNPRSVIIPMSTSRIDTTAPHEPNVSPGMSAPESRHAGTPRDPRGRRGQLLAVAFATVLALAGVAFAVGQYNGGYNGGQFTFTSATSTLDTRPVAPAVAQAPRLSAEACSGTDRNTVGNNVVVAENEW